VCGGVFGIGAEFEFDFEPPPQKKPDKKKLSVVCLFFLFAITTANVAIV
jgi:hypothetical protein